MDMLIKEKAKIIRSEVKCPDILNGLVVSVIAFWALWISSSLVMHFLKG
jgi:hypothetical protein